jgi:hypothetical protein
MATSKEFGEIKELLDTNMTYIRIELSEVKNQLKRQNGSIGELRVDCATNKSETQSNRRLIWGVLIGIVLSGIIAVALANFGVTI